MENGENVHILASFAEMWPQVLTDEMETEVVGSDLEKTLQKDVRQGVLFCSPLHYFPPSYCF